MGNIVARVKNLAEKNIDLGIVSLHKDGSYSYRNPESNDLKYLSGQEYDDLTRRHRNINRCLLAVHSGPNQQ